MGSGFFSDTWFLREKGLCLKALKRLLDHLRRIHLELTHQLSEDIVLLHYAGVVQHSLGSDAELADLISKMCREVNRDAEKESYLHLLASDVNEYCNKNWNKWIAELSRLVWIMLRILAITYIVLIEKK
ncbi:hypothetical protein Sjap_003894 [Stephania japonica]|uniref:Uncharacterized protein n=1 Tax=Stephania japonica TaxID=461633 RepID=A0AAP0PVX6_9MAGN